MHTEDKLYLVVALLFIALTFLAPHALSQTGDSVNYENVSVTTQVNITNSFPEVVSVTMANLITLNAGGTKAVECNATVRDFDGGGTIQSVNATFFDQNVVQYNDSDNENNHYTNTSCTQVGTAGDNSANYTCTFPVQYYANNGTNWNCTVVAEDDQGATGNNSLLTEIDSILALNVTPDTIDYGDLAVTDTSSLQNANITNFGNVPINVSVYGYGETIGDKLAMTCANGNISIDEEKFSLNSSDVWGSMEPLNESSKPIRNLTIEKRTNTTGNDIFNSTYWSLRIPQSSNPSGECNGTVVFQAETS